MIEMTDVLIVGAGPSGLMLACLLHDHDINFIILDKATDVKRSSGALVIHASSIELFHQLGIIDSVLSMATRVNTISFSLKHNPEKKHSVNISSLSGKYNYPSIILLEQYKLEGILREYLWNRGKRIQNTLFLKYQTEGKTVNAIVTDSDGNKTIKCKFLIGADGKESLIRSLANIPYTKESDERPIFIFDVIGKSPAAINEMFFSFSKKKSFGCFPLKSGVIRIDGYIPEINHVDEITPELIFPYLPSEIEIDSIKWFSVFHGNHLLCKTFSANNIFVIGDAAHTHNPVGGQGMNSGFQDALNLAWKLAFVIKGTANNKLLDTYSEERKPVVEKIMNSSRRIFRLVTAKKKSINFINQIFFHSAVSLISILLKNRHFRQQIFLNVSQLWIKYKSSLVLKGSINRRLRPGMLFRVSLIEHAIIKSTNFRLLVFKKIETLQNYHELKSFPIEITEVTKIDNPRLFHEYHIRENTILLLRPDNFIVFVTSELDIGKLQCYFRRLM